MSVRAEADAFTDREGRWLLTKSPSQFAEQEAADVAAWAHRGRLRRHPARWWHACAHSWAIARKTAPSRWPRRRRGVSSLLLQSQRRLVRRALADLGLLDDEPRASRGSRLSAPKIAAQPADEERIARAQRIWDESRPITYTLAGAYLGRRAIPASLWASGALRFHARMTSLDDRAAARACRGDHRCRRRCARSRC
jgi:hypothetical protein